MTMNDDDDDDVNLLILYYCVFQEERRAVEKYSEKTESNSHLKEQNKAGRHDHEHDMHATTEVLIC